MKKEHEKDNNCETTGNKEVRKEIKNEFLLMIFVLFLFSIYFYSVILMYQTISQVTFWSLILSLCICVIIWIYWQMRTINRYKKYGFNPIPLEIIK